MSAETSERYNIEVEKKKKNRKKGNASAKKQGEVGGIPGDIQGMKRRDRNENGPMDSAKTLKLRFSVGDLDLPERRKRYISQ